MFKCVKSSAGTMNVPETVYLPITADEAVAEGEALVLSGGKLTKATASVNYIALKSQTGGEIPCMRVTSNDVFECEITSDLSENDLGDLLALSSDGMNVGAKSTSGKAEIVSFQDGKTVGKKVFVRFI